MSNTKDLKEIKGKDALRITHLAQEFSDIFSSAFNDWVIRGIIWTEPNNDSTIFIQVLASDSDGRYVKFVGQYQVDSGEFFCNKKMAKSFINAKVRDNAVDALLTFIEGMTTMKYPINKILFDLGVRKFSTVKIGKSPVEEGSIDVYICAYSDQAKDDFSFTDARKLVNDNLVSF